MDLLVLLGSCVCFWLGLSDEAIHYLLWWDWWFGSSSLQQARPDTQVRLMWLSTHTEEPTTILCSYLYFIHTGTSSKAQCFCVCIFYYHSGNYGFTHLYIKIKHKKWQLLKKTVQYKCNLILLLWMGCFLFIVHMTVINHSNGNLNLYQFYFWCRPFLRAVGEEDSNNANTAHTLSLILEGNWIFVTDMHHYKSDAIQNMKYAYS